MIGCVRDESFIRQGSEECRVWSVDCMHCDYLLTTNVTLENPCYQHRGCWSCQDCFHLFRVGEQKFPHQKILFQHPGSVSQHKLNNIIIDIDQEDVLEKLYVKDEKL